MFPMKFFKLFVHFYRFWKIRTRNKFQETFPWNSWKERQVPASKLEAFYVDDSGIKVSVHCSGLKLVLPPGLTFFME